MISYRSCSDTQDARANLDINASHFITSNCPASAAVTGSGIPFPALDCPFLGTSNWLIAKKNYFFFGSIVITPVLIPILINNFQQKLFLQKKI
jgi:hypothetical protein